MVVALGANVQVLVDLLAKQRELAAVAAHKAGYRATTATIIGAGIGFLAALVRFRMGQLSIKERSTAGDLVRRPLIAGIEIPVSTEPQSAGESKPAWKAWLRLVGGFQSRILLTTFYFVAVMPFGILAGIFGDRLGRKALSGDSFWRGREAETPHLEASCRQS